LHKLDPNEIVFDLQYDLTALFQQFNYLKITAIAEKANLNATLLRQYVTGIKHASPQQAKKVEVAIHKIGKELAKITVYAA
jgi:predicted transcriptional regulator